MQKILFLSKRNIKKVFSSLFMAIIKNFIIRGGKNSEEEKIFSLSIKKPFELKFMPGRLKLYLRSRDVCTYWREGMNEKKEDGRNQHKNKHTHTPQQNLKIARWCFNNNNKIMEWKAKTSTTYHKDSDRFVTANSVIPEEEEARMS